MKKLLVLIVLVAALCLLWARWFRNRPSAANAAGTAASLRLAASPALAESADAKLQILKSGAATSIALHANELQSLLQYRFLQLLPAFVDSPQIDLAEDRIHVRARVPVERLPTISDLGEAASFLPDTAEIGLTGTLLPLDSGRVALAIDEVRAARIPLPQRLVPRALQRLGRRDEPGLPPAALALPLPPGAAAAYVRGDSLVLLAQPIPRSND
jgi:hypothetical protein